MAALTRMRNAPRLGGGDQAVHGYQDVPLKANAKVYLGALVVINAGYGQQGSTATGLIAAGIAAFDPAVPLVDNTGLADGAQTIRVAQGVFPFDNSAAGDLIAQADVGKVCYVVDDHTVAKTSGGSTRSQAGVIMGIDPAGRVYVSVGLQLQPPGAGAGTAVVATVVQGTGITVNATDPANPIVTNSAPSDTPTWLANARARAASLSGGALKGAREWWTDYLDTISWGTTVVGTGAAALSATLDGGVVQLTTGTTGTSQVKVHPAAKPPLISDVTTKRMYIYHRVRFEGAASTNTKNAVGAANPALGKWVQFGVVGTTVVAGGSNTKFVIETFDGVTPVETLTTINIETALYHDVELYIDGAGNATFYLDGVLAGTVSITTAVGVTPAMPVGQAYTQDTTNRTLDIDASYAAFLGQ